MYIIPKDRIFSSRTDDFEREITRLTAGRGIDVILNTTSGELLEASWNLVAEGGTMIELGRKDIGMHNRLAMEPFGRGASFRAFDHCRV
jgi:NADPH:quinone reductase-like Zn-dependent oxidoreductase